MSVLNYLAKSNMDIIQLRKLLTSSSMKKELILPLDSFTKLKVNSNENRTLIKLDNMKEFNSIGWDFMREFYTILNTFNFKNTDNKLILYGDDTNKVFCPGANLKENQEHDIQKYLKFFNLSYYNFDFLSSKRNNLISIWNGIVMGGGVGLSISSSIRIATESTQFAMPETKIGFYTNCFANTFFPNFLDYQTCLYSSMLSDKIVGIDVAKLGIANYFILNKFIPEIIKYINDSTEIDPDYFQELLFEFQEKSYEESKFTFEFKPSPCYYKNYHLITKYFSEKNFEKFYENILRIDSNNIIDQFEKEFVANAQKEIKARSYLILRTQFYYNEIAFDKNIHSENKKNFDLKLGKILGDCEHMEGIRALLVRKDNDPKWKYNDHNSSEEIFQKIKSINLNEINLI